MGEENTEKCTCTPCRECEGTGNVWFSFSGEYLRKHRLDDMDEMETCDECHGGRIEEVCDHCRLLEEEVSNGL